jgi:flavin reductase (DIM6/NTAB) family NADH-FMN oxidoreductase RutF
MRNKTTQIIENKGYVMPEPNRQTTVDALEYRRTMGLFATGVSVLALHKSDGEIIAMTANAISSVSLEPVLLLVCVARNAHILPHLMGVDTFTFSFLSETQEPLSSSFAGLWDEDITPPGFEFEDWDGRPRLRGSIGAIACRRHKVYEGGDHLIVLAEVTDLYRPENTGKPLIFYRGGYTGIQDKWDSHNEV